MSAVAENFITPPQSEVFGRKLVAVRKRQNSQACRQKNRGCNNDFLDRLGIDVGAFLFVIIERHVLVADDLALFIRFCFGIPSLFPVKQMKHNKPRFFCFFLIRNEPY